MRKLSLIVLLLGVLVLGVIVLWQQGVFQSDDDTTFAVENSDDVGLIFMADKGNQTIKIQRSNGQWTVNDSVPAADYMVKELLATLRLIQVSRPVPRAAHNNIVRSMTAENIKVEVYDRDGDAMSIFYVGGPATNSRGNYMRKEGSDNIYIVEIPGFDGMLQTRFPTKVTEWQDKTVFDYQPGEIAAIDLFYEESPEASFNLMVVQRDSFLLSSPGNPEIVPGYVLDQRKIASYVNLFRDINAEGFVNYLSNRDSIAQGTPYATLTVTDTSGQVNEVSFFRKAVNQRTKVQMDQEGREVPYDLDRAYALINDGRDLVLVQQFVFGKLFRTYRSFFSIEV